MRRGESVAEGFVNFPFDSAEYSGTAGMGLYVKLVVLNQTGGMCVGSYVTDMLSGVLLGDDKRPQPPDLPAPEYPPEAIAAHMEKETQEYKEWVAFHFPRHAETDKTVEDMLSRDYRASILLGSTGWAGYSELHGNWCAGFDDLTPQGQELYRLMERLNPGCSVHILTFLDT